MADQSIIDALFGGPSWLERANQERQKSLANYLQGGVPAMMENTQDIAGLAGGFGGITKAQPRIFWRGIEPGRTERISTGNADFDKNLFMSSNKDSAAMYGSQLTQYEALPEAKILYEGSSDFRKVAGTWRKDESMLDFASRATNAAKKAGYDAIHFERQGDIGTAIFDPSKFKEVF